MTPRVHRLDIGGDRIVLDDFGPPDAAAVVLLHGFTGDRTSWTPVASALAARRRVLVPDLPGHGDTRTGDVPERCTMAHATGLLAAALRRLGLTAATLIGYSMGGRLALYVALERPALVRALVLESASPGLASAAERAARRDADEALARFALARGTRAFAARWEAMPLFASQGRLPAAERAAVRARRTRCRPAGLAASLRGMGPGAQPWLGDRLGELTVPVMLITGALDEKFTRLAAALRPRVAGGEHVEVAEAGHTVHLEAPGRFVETVENFLDREGEVSCRSTG